MIKPCPLLKSLTDQLMEEVRAYGILEVSTEQYQIICNSIIKFGEARQVVSYSPAFMIPIGTISTGDTLRERYARSTEDSNSGWYVCYLRL